MQGLMMDYPLTLSAIFRRAEALYGPEEIVARNAEKSIHRYHFSDWADRARRLASAFESLGLKPGDRIATLAWNHGAHLEAYFAIPLMGGVLHTLNLRLHPDELAYIVNHAGDKAVVVDASLLPLWEKVRPQVKVPIGIVIGGTSSAPGQLDYEQVVASASRIVDRPDVDERSAAAMCYTTGTTGLARGVVYSHRSTVIHTMAQSMKACMNIGEEDTVLPVVPMFHANAWGMPFAAIMNGAKIVNPGPHLDPASILDLFVRERPTIVGGVPTIWIGVQALLDQSPPGTYDLSSIKSMFVGGSAVPQSLIESYEKKYGLRIIQAWGMTEMSPLGSVAHEPPRETFASDTERFKYRAKQGRPAPFVEIRAQSEEGIAPWDGQTMGELEVRGPWISSAYYNRPDASDRFTDDGWFKTGDIVTIDKSGTIQVQDRSKDVIKSGGEWISSVALECALMGHPAVAEAAVISVEHPKWAERPLAAVVLKPGQKASPAELKAFLAPNFPKFWLPDAFEFVEAIPRTSAGKFKKSELRKQFKDYRLAE